jgi:hypothetical protein
MDWHSQMILCDIDRPCIDNRVNGGRWLDISRRPLETRLTSDLRRRSVDPNHQPQRRSFLGLPGSMIACSITTTRLGECMPGFR